MQCCWGQSSPLPSPPSHKDEAKGFRAACLFFRANNERKKGVPFAFYVGFRNWHCLLYRPVAHFADTSPSGFHPTNFEGWFPEHNWRSAQLSFRPLFLFLGRGQESKSHLSFPAQPLSRFRHQGVWAKYLSKRFAFLKTFIFLYNVSEFWAFWPRRHCYGPWRLDCRSNFQKAYPGECSTLNVSLLFKCAVHTFLTAWVGKGGEVFCWFVSGRVFFRKQQIN